MPEPTTACLLAPFGVAAALVRRGRRRAAKCAAIAVAAVATVGSGSLERSALAQAIPAPSVDRNYRMGDNDPGAANNGFVSTTRDAAGVPNMNQLIHLLGVAGAGGLPRYVTISGRPDGGTGLGIRVNNAATDTLYLRTGFDEALNFPERSPSSTESTLGGPLQGTIDYRFITDRGFQLWVQPFAATESYIVMDSNNHGAFINSAGKFAMKYSGFDYQGMTSVVPNSWYHLMVVRPRGQNNGSILYVNGVAEAAATGIYNGENAPNDEVDPVNHDNSPLVIGSTTSENGFEVGAGRFFRGIVDDLEMFVMGLNNTRDFGEFQFQRDNDYAAFFAPTTPGDLNNDHVINMTDVTTFAANWRRENVLTWMQGGGERALAVGDLTSRSWGDYNYDGRVNLTDWGILNSVNPAMGAAAMQLIQGVPEPSSLALAASSLALVGGAGCRKTLRRRKSSSDLRTP